MTQPTDKEINDVLASVFAEPDWSDEQWNEYIATMSGNRSGKTIMSFELVTGLKWEDAMQDLLDQSTVNSMAERGIRGCFTDSKGITRGATR